MDLYAQLNWFYHDRIFQAYMNDFMYVDHQTITVEDFFTDTKKIVENYKKLSTPEAGQKHWLVFCFIHSEDYELDENYDETEILKTRPHIQR